MVTSAMPRLRREVDPLKMTSAISPPRRLLALCSPSIQRTASTMLLLPEPLGPTIAVMPSPKVKLVLSAKLLNPIKSSRLSMQPPRNAHVPIRIAELGDEAKHGIAGHHSSRTVQNPKSEIRISKSETNSKSQIRKLEAPGFGHSNFEFR